MQQAIRSWGVIDVLAKNVTAVTIERRSGNRTRRVGLNVIVANDANTWRGLERIDVMGCTPAAAPRITTEFSPSQPNSENDYSDENHSHDGHRDSPLGRKGSKSASEVQQGTSSLAVKSGHLNDHYVVVTVFRD